MPKTTIKLITIMSFLLSVSLIAGCSESNSKEAEEPEVFAIPVAVNTLERGDISSTYHSTAVLESMHDATVISRVTGIIEQLTIDEGDYVEKGQLIAQIDSRRYQLRLAQAQAELASLNQELHRLTKMKKKKLVSADQIDKLSYAQQKAQAAYDLAALELKDSRIIAPISGYIANRFVKQGHFTQGYQQIVDIVDQQHLQAVVHLPEHQLANVKPQQVAYLNFSALPQQRFAAAIRSVSPIVNNQSGTFKVIMSLDNSDAKLKPGMFAQVSLVFATHNDALTVPSDAIINRDGQQYVFVINDSKAQEVPITPGFVEHQFTEISGEIVQGAQIVVSGQHNLKHDALVKVITPTLPDTELTNISSDNTTNSAL